MIMEYIYMADNDSTGVPDPLFFNYLIIHILKYKYIFNYFIIHTIINKKNYAYFKTIIGFLS